MKTENVIAVGYVIILSLLIGVLITLTACGCSPTYVTASALDRANDLCANNDGIRLISIHWYVDHKSYYSVRCNNAAKFEYIIEEQIKHDSLAK